MDPDVRIQPLGFSSGLGTTPEGEPVGMKSEEEKSDKDYAHLLDDCIEELASSFSPQRQKIFRLRFGVDDGKWRTYKEIGKECNISAQRACSLLQEMISRLMRTSRVEYIERIVWYIYRLRKEKNFKDLDQ